MVVAIIYSVLLWLSFLIISTAIVYLAVVGAYYGLKLIDKTEAWYKKENNDKQSK
jgi:hypothetical protein